MTGAYLLPAPRLHVQLHQRLGVAHLHVHLRRISMLGRQGELMDESTRVAAKVASQSTDLVQLLEVERTPL